MRRSYKFRVRPTSPQHGRLNLCLKSHRGMYNAALQERKEAYEHWKRTADRMVPDPRPGITYASQANQLKEIRACCPDDAVWNFSSHQATLRRLDGAFAAFFRRVKKGETPGYPRFKGLDRFDSVTWPSHGDGCKWKPEASRVYLQGIGDVKVDVHRPIEGVVKTITIKREANRWFVILSCDLVPTHELEPTHEVAGIDVGVASFLTTSDGEQVGNPRFGARAADDLAHAQRVLARKKRGSRNRKDSRATVGARHRKIANQRRDFHHKTALGLVRSYDLLVVEDLRIDNMTASASGTAEAPGANVAQKSGLNRSILDAGWGQFIACLSAKAEDAGRTVVAVNPRHTSQTCPECGHVERGNRLTQALFRCLQCGFQGHADVVGARNILRAGLARLAAVQAVA